MLCKHCGKEISDTSIFCNYCGQKIENNQFTDCMTVRIAPYPMFDICMQLMWEDTDFECESQKLNQICW